MERRPFGRSRLAAIVAGTVLVVALPTGDRANAHFYEVGRTEFADVWVCNEAGRMYRYSSGCLLTSTPVPKEYCDTADQPLTLGASILGFAASGPVPISEGSVSFEITKSDGTPVRQLGSQPIVLGQGQPGTAGGLPSPVHLDFKLPVGDYVVKAEYLGGYQLHGHESHPFWIQWPPVSKTSPLSIVDCGSPVAVAKTRRQKATPAGWRVASARCEPRVNHLWKIYGQGGAPMKTMTGCSVVIPDKFGTTDVSRITLTRQVFPNTDWTVPVRIFPTCPIKPPSSIDLAEVDWSQWGDATKIRFKKAMFARWRQGHPVGSRTGSPEAFRAYAELVNSFLEGDAPPSPEMGAAWQSLQQAGGEFANLGPVLFDTLQCSLTYEGLSQALDTSVAIVNGVISSGNSFLQGVSIAAVMLYDSPQTLYDSVALFGQMAGRGDLQSLLLMASDFGVNVTKQQATAFLDTMAQVNEAAIKGDDKMIADLFGKMAGQAIFDQLLAVGAAKAAKVDVSELPEKMRRTYDKALGRVAPDVIEARRLQLKNLGEINVRELRANGVDDFRAQHVSAIAEETGTMIEFRPGNELGLERIVNNEALAKPEGLAHAKTVKAQDIEIGAPADAEGLSWWGEPKDPGLHPDSPLQKYYEQKRADYARTEPLREWLQKDPSTRGPIPKGFEADYAYRYNRGAQVTLQIKIDADGIVRDVATNKPFGPDLDLWAVLDSKTGQLASPEKVREVYRRLGIAVDVQHGPGTAHWSGPQSTRDALFGQHGNVDNSFVNANARPLLRFGGRSDTYLPVKAFADRVQSEAWIRQHPNFGVK